MMESSDGIIDIWTDGACFPNPGKGGWAWTDTKGLKCMGADDPTTNQKMELMAVISALEELPGRDVRIISDSQYVIKGATSWSRSWRLNGWKTTQGKPVANRDLWKRLLDACKGRYVEFKWVRGHSGDPGNEEADKLATEASGADVELIEKCSRRWH